MFVILNSGADLPWGGGGGGAAHLVVSIIILEESSTTLKNLLDYTFSIGRTSTVSVCRFLETILLISELMRKYHRYLIYTR
jgi:hypothetical protein